MSLTRYLVLFLAGVSLMACSNQNTEGEDLGGRNVTQSFLEQYSGFYQEKSDVDSSASQNSPETITLNTDGEIEVSRVRHVGRANNPAIPEGTTCGYTMKGRLHYVIEIDNENRKRVSSEGDTFFDPSTHYMTFSVLEMQLSDQMRSQSSSDQGCQNFINEMHLDLPTYTLYMELFGNGMIRFHTSGGGDYDGKDRPTSTLDEVFVRQ